MSRVRPDPKIQVEVPSKRWRLTLSILVCLVAYIAVAYGHALHLAFVNDDYVILDKIRGASFLDLWKPKQLLFGWYRPWSREFHYWALEQLFGLNEPIFHAISFGLWLSVLLLYFVLIRRIAGAAAAAVATAGVAALGLWGGPLLWVAGAQDLWMLFFGLLALLAITRGRSLLAVLPFVLALLSKETAAALPSIAVAWLWIANRQPLLQAFRKTAALWAALVAWFVLHPTLTARLFTPSGQSEEVLNRPTPLTTLFKTLLAQINLGLSFAPEMGLGQILVPSLLGAAILGGFVGVALWRSHPHPQQRAILLGVVWTICGWWILFLPSIGWHAYYGVLGTLGCWLALGAALSRYRFVAISVVMALAILREGQAASLSWDWGTDWYQTRAGTILRSIRARLFELHPTLPPHSRLYFAEIPNAIGLLAGDGPALRIWYDDPTLRGLYLSAYCARAPGDSLGEDHFFFFEPSRALVEDRSGPWEDPQWHKHHDVLASTFVRAGDLSGAAQEYGKLSRAFPKRPDYALYAGAILKTMGRDSEAEHFYAVARESLSADEVRSSAAMLISAARHYHGTAMQQSAGR